MTAARYNTTADITHVLLQHGGDVTLHDDNAMTAVMFACRDADHHLPVLQALLNHHTGARVQLEDRDGCGWTSVMWAVYSNSPGCLRLLLDMGASTDGWYIGGQTVLEKAKKKGYTEVIRVLEEHSRTAGELLAVFCFIHFICMYQSHKIKGCEILPVLLVGNRLF